GRPSPRQGVRSARAASPQPGAGGAAGAARCADLRSHCRRCERLRHCGVVSADVARGGGGGRERGGILAAAASGSLVLDCSTSDRHSTRRLGERLAERGIALVDAGMTRGVAGAKQGTLAFFLGGEAGAIERAMPVLQALGDTFIHVGPLGHGPSAKLISNVLSYGTVALVNEALMLGARAGLDASRLLEALGQGAPSKALESFGPRIAAGDYEP